MKDNFSNSAQIEVVSTFPELVHTQFHGTMNALCWRRDLDGDFSEIAAKLQLEENVTEVYPEDLTALSLSARGSKARDIILTDLQLLTDFGASPSLNLIKNYQRDEELEFIATDVYSWHVDRSAILTDTFLCTYYGASSDVLANDQAEQKILIPEFREKLLELQEGSESDFETFLTTNYYDLHYQAKPDAEPMNLGLGHLWRLAVDHPDQKVLPCIHRAPVENEGEYRLMLIC